MVFKKTDQHSHADRFIRLHMDQALSPSRELKIWIGCREVVGYTTRRSDTGDLHHMPMLDRLDQMVYRVDRNDASGDNERNAVTKPLSLLDIVGGQKNGGPEPMELGDELPQLPGAGYVDTRGGFVQEEDRGLVDDPGGDGELAFHTLGIDAEFAFSRLGQTKGVQKLPGACLSIPFAHSIESSAEAQVVETGQLRIKVAFVWDHANQVLGRSGVFDTIDAAHPDCSRVRLRQTGQHVDGRGLAGPIWAQKTEQFTGMDLKINLRDGPYLTKPLCQAPHLDSNGVVSRHHHTLFCIDTDR
jgi:hypothetical protein